MATFWATFGKIVLFFTATSGHTGHECSNQHKTELLIKR